MVVKANILYNADDTKAVENIVRMQKPSRQEKQWIPGYRHYLVYALVLHAVILIALVGGLVITDRPTQMMTHSIQATVQRSIPKDKATIAAEQRARARAIARAQAIAKAQAAKAEAARLRQLALAKARAIAEKQRLAKIHQQALQQQQAALTKRILDNQLRAEQLHLQQASAAARAAAQAKRTAQVINQYQQRILQSISQVWVIPRNIDTKLYCVVAIALAPDGSVLKASISQSSGSSLLDQTALQAVYQASPLPVPSDPALFSEFRNLRLTLRPEKIVHVS